MNSPGWHGHTPAGESASNEVQLGSTVKSDAGSVYAPHCVSGWQRDGCCSNADGTVQFPPTRPPTHLPPPMQKQSDSAPLPLPDVVDHRGHSAHEPSATL